MANINEAKWTAKYGELKRYVELHHQLPDKKKTEGRNLLNWWKYNRRLMKRGTLSSERVTLLCILSDMRTVKRADWADV